MVLPALSSHIARLYFQPRSANKRGPMWAERGRRVCLRLCAGRGHIDRFAFVQIGTEGLGFSSVHLRGVGFALEGMMF